jgi:hypothetical protein
MAANLEQRIAVLEQQVAALQHQQTLRAPTGREWLDDLYGAFAGDPVFKQAMNMGRQYRNSTRPGSRKRKPRR